MDLDNSSTKRDIINTSFTILFQIVVLIARIIQVPILLSFMVLVIMGIITLFLSQVT